MKHQDSSTLSNCTLFIIRLLLGIVSIILVVSLAAPRQRRRPTSQRSMCPVQRSWPGRTCCTLLRQGHRTAVLNVPKCAHIDVLGLHPGYGAVDGAVVGLVGAADGAVLEVLELHRGLILAAEAVADGRAGHLAGVLRRGCSRGWTPCFRSIHVSMRRGEGQKSRNKDRRVVAARSGRREEVEDCERENVKRGKPGVANGGVRVPWASPEGHASASGWQPSSQMARPAVIRGIGPRHRGPLFANVVPFQSS